MMGHASYGILVEGVKNGAYQGIKLLQTDLLDHKSDQCEPCIMGKQHKSSYPRSNSVHAPLGVVCSDLCGPFKPGLRGERYWMALKDLGTGYGEAAGLRHK